jgi:hypothetical protein
MLGISKNSWNVQPMFRPSDTWFVVGPNTVTGAPVGSLLKSFEQHCLFYDAVFFIDGNFHVSSLHFEIKYHWFINQKCLCYFICVPATSLFCHFEVFFYNVELYHYFSM